MFNATITVNEISSAHNFLTPNRESNRISMKIKQILIGKTWKDNKKKTKTLSWEAGYARGMVGIYRS